MIVKVNGFPITAPYQAIDSVHHTPHTGIDLAIQQGTDILSPVCGIVEKVVDYGSQNIGKGVMVKFDGTKELIFGHLSKISVHKGDIIYIGQKLGEAGSTGHSTGSHLHLGLKDLATGQFLDPTVYGRMFQKIYVLHYAENEIVHHAIEFSKIAANMVKHFY